jgi:hypothetical protein
MWPNTLVDIPEDNNYLAFLHRTIVPERTHPVTRRMKKLGKRGARRIAGAWLYAMINLGDDPDSELLTPDEQSMVTEEGRKLLRRYAVDGVDTLDSIISAVTGRNEPAPRE